MKAISRPMLANIATNATGIASNAGRIIVNSNRIGTNATNIASNTSLLADHTVSIAGNTTLILANSDAISGLSEGLAAVSALPDMYLSPGAKWSAFWRPLVFTVMMSVLALPSLFAAMIIGPSGPPLQAAARKQQVSYKCAMKGFNLRTSTMVYERKFLIYWAYRLY